MKIKDFLVEQWMNAYEDGAKYNIAETCVDSLSLNQLFELLGNGEEVLDDIINTRLTYGHIFGSPELKQYIGDMYGGISEKNIITTNGAIGANFLSMYSLIEPGDEVVSVLPTYQQMYSIPESLGANVKILQLKPENNFLPDVDELKVLVSKNTKMICINNPNNPAGSLISEDMLLKIVEIAKEVDAYVHSDEVYRGLYQEEDVDIPSIINLYDKGISTGSMSKVFSLAGLRLGWIVTNEEIINKVAKRRDYNTISCGVIDEKIATYVLKNRDKLLKRNHQIIRENLKILDQWVNKEKRVSYIKPKAGTTAFIKYHLEIPSVDFCKGLIEEMGVLVVPGKCFDMEGYFRIGYAFNKNHLETGLKKISDYMDMLEQD